MRALSHVSFPDKLWMDAAGHPILGIEYVRAMHRARNL